jgi:hypothetical protein
MILFFNLDYRLKIFFLILDIQGMPKLTIIIQKEGIISGDGEQGRLLSTMTAEILYIDHDPMAQLQFPAFQTNCGNCHQFHAAHEQS